MFNVIDIHYIGFANDLMHLSDLLYLRDVIQALDAICLQVLAQLRVTIPVLINEAKFLSFLP